MVVRHVLQRPTKLRGNSIAEQDLAGFDSSTAGHGLLKTSNIYAGIPCIYRTVIISML